MRGWWLEEESRGEQTKVTQTRARRSSLEQSSQGGGGAESTQNLGMDENATGKSVVLCVRFKKKFKF